MEEPRAFPFRRLLLLFLLSRLLLEIVGVLSMFYFPPASAVARIKDLSFHKPQTAFLEMWVHWDSEWWLLVAERGYLSHDAFKEFGGGRYMPQETVKFFPEYPLAIRAVSVITGNTVLAGFLVANIAAIVFLFYLYRLGSVLFNPDTGSRSVWMYVVFPTGFFLSAVYSESMFLACLTAAFYYLEQKRLLPACIAAGLSILCRSQALLALPILIWLAASRFPEIRVRAAVTMLVATLLPLGCYLFYIHLAFGSITWITETVRYWRGDTRYPLFALVRFFSERIAIHGQHNSLIDFTFAALHLGVLAASFRKIAWPYWVYSAIMILFPLSSTLFSFSRLCLANIPFFLYVANRSERNFDFVLIPCLMLQAFFMAAFANGYWVG